LLAASLLSGCSLGYYGQSIGGHLDLLQRARPVADWVDDGATPQELRERLRLAQRMRDFAVRELALPDNPSYRRYAELPRPAAVWNVVAAPELSLTLQTWCFPVVGCVGYRGYFDRAQADALAAQLRAQGLEVSVYGVPAYSTLGWTSWLGGDPLLSTFIRWPEGELARLPFNESYATAVERLGVERWLRQADPAAQADYAAHEARRQDFRALTAAVRRELEAVYRGTGSDETKRERKAAVMATLRADHQRLKHERWGGFAGYDGWFERANNASLGVLAAYDDLVPAFERLFEQQGRDFARFHAEVRRIAALPRAERAAALRR
jgi:predicted aminopeptidase